MKRYHWLANAINKHQYTQGAEVGTATGNTTLFLMQQCPSLQLIAVDDWRPIPGSGQWESDDMEEVFNKKLKGYLNTRIRKLKGLSWEMATFVEDGSLDIVFVDASHDPESVKKDLTAWTSKIKPTGMLCGHDLHFAGVREALSYFDLDFNEVGIDNCWFIYKKDIVVPELL